MEVQAVEHLALQALGTLRLSPHDPCRDHMIQVATLVTDALLVTLLYI